MSNLLVPGRIYRIAGPGGEYVMTGLSTAGETATVHLVTTEEWVRIRLERDDLAESRRVAEGLRLDRIWRPRGGGDDGD